MSKETNTHFFQFDNRTVASVVMGFKEFEKVLSQLEPLFASEGVDLDQIRTSGTLFVRHTEDCGWLFKKYDVPQDHTLVLMVRGMADRFFQFLEEGVFRSADNRTVTLYREDSIEDFRKEILTGLDIEEQEKLEEFIKEFVRELSPDGVLVEDVRSVNLKHLWKEIQEYLISSFGDKPLLVDLMKEMPAALERTWRTNSIDILRDWDISDYLERMLGASILAYKLD